MNTHDVVESAVKLARENEREACARLSEQVGERLADAGLAGADIAWQIAHIIRARRAE